MGICTFFPFSSVTLKTSVIRPFNVSTCPLTTMSCRLFKAPVSCTSKLAWLGPVIVITVHSGSVSLSKRMFSGRLLKLDVGASGSNVAVAAQTVAACANNSVEIFIVSAKTAWRALGFCCTATIQQPTGSKCATPCANLLFTRASLPIPGLLVCIATSLLNFCIGCLNPGCLGGLRGARQRCSPCEVWPAELGALCDTKIATPLRGCS